MTEVNKDKFHLIVHYNSRVVVLTFKIEVK